MKKKGRKEFFCRKAVDFSIFHDTFRKETWKELLFMRSAEVARKTRETDISVSWNLDGEGASEITTGIPFMDHMLTLFAKHGKFDLRVKAVGDLEIDCHHTMEDLGLTMGKALVEALGDKSGITRYGHMLLPMDEVLAQVALDLSGRPFLVYDVPLSATYIRELDTALFGEFFRAFSNAAAMNLHIRILNPGETHHVLEAVFKGFGRTLRMAVEMDPREKGIPSTKGSL